jgi:hypothetical protein
MKACSSCGQVKQASEFYRRQASNDGLQKQCKPCSNERVARKRASNREYMRSYMRSDAGRAACRRHLLKKKYGLTTEQFNKLLTSQEHSCACCGRKEAGGRSNQWNVDHCHVTGEVRGLLCNSCNVGLGCLGDDLQGIRNALSYLERHYNGSP